MKKFTFTHQLRLTLIVLSLFSFLATHAITVYFKDVNNAWGAVNIHIWDASIGSENSSAWPGRTMMWKATNGSDTWYKYELQSTTASMKFNKVGDSDASQTSNYTNITTNGWFDTGASGIQSSSIPSGLNFQLSVSTISLSSDALGGWDVRNSMTASGNGIYTLVKQYTKESDGIDVYYDNNKQTFIARSSIIGHLSSMVGKLATFTWNANTNVLTMTAGIPIIASQPSPIDAGTTVTLTASASLEPSNFVWDYSINNGGTWLPYTDAKSGTKDRTITVTPTTTTIYRAKMGTDDGTFELMVKKVCTHETRTLFVDDFGTLTNLTDRTTSPYVPTANYTYKANPLEINDGHYAVAPTPRHAGCGTSTGGSVANCNASGDFWYVDLKDKSNKTSSPYGGMLFVNCLNKDVVYTRQTIVLPPNVEITFSAWFANAQNPSRGTKVDINMRFQILNASNSLVPGSIIDVPAIGAGTGWFYGETSINSGAGGLFTVQILNNGDSGDGNDVLIDDIELKVCVPEVTLNIDGGTSKNITGLNTPSPLTVPESVTSLFTSPYYLWLEYNTENAAWEEVSDFSGINKPTNNTSFTSHTPSTKQYKVYVASDRANALTGFTAGTGLYVVTNPVSVNLCDIITQPSTTDQEYCQFSTASSLSVAAISGSETLSYQWYKNTTNSNTGGTLLPGAVSNTYTPLTTAAGTHYYYVEVSSANGCTLTSDVSGSIKVNPKITPTFDSVGPYCAGSTIPALATSSTNVPAIIGTWSPTISNTATQTYTFAPASSECAYSATLQIVVNDNPTTPSISLDCSLGYQQGVLSVTSPIGADYQYALNGGDYQDSPDFSNMTNGNKTILAQHKTTLCTSQQASIDVSCGCANPPTLTLTSANGTTCHLNPITITDNTFGGSTTEVTMSHNGNGAFSTTVFTSSPFSFTYTPDISDAGKTITLTATSNNPLGSPCLEASKTYSLEVEELILPNFEAVVPICANALLNALPEISTNGITGTWSPALDNTQTTEYTFTPTSGQCASEAKLSIVVHALPAQVMASVTEQPTCTTLSGTIVIDNHVADIQYSLNGADYVNETSFTNLLPGNYTILARNANQCISEASNALVINETTCLVMSKTVNKPTPNIGDNVIFTLTVKNNGPSDAAGVVVTDILPDGYTFISAPAAYNATSGVWTIGSIAATASASIQITATVNTVGNYTNTATITDGDTKDPDTTDNTDEATTNPIHVPPVANNDNAYTNENSSTNIPVTNNDVFGAANAPKTGSVIIITQPTHGTATVHNNGTPTNPTDDYIVYVPTHGFFGDDVMEYEIKNYHEETDRATVSIIVSGLIIPDGFSPNEDGINDIFEIQRSSNLTINLIVFNRWGNKVFEKANYANDWDGTGINNQALPEGTYYRIVEATNTTTGNTQKLTGVITLKR